MPSSGGFEVHYTLESLSSTNGTAAATIFLGNSFQTYIGITLQSGSVINWWQNGSVKPGYTSPGILQGYSGFPTPPTGTKYYIKVNGFVQYGQVSLYWYWSETM